MKRALVVLLVVAAAIAGFLAYLGYFGGPVFTRVAADNPRPRTAVLLLSGDMGFRVGMGPPVAARLAEAGVPVIGVNSLTFFRVKRSPAEIGRLLRAGLARTQALAPGRKLVVVGQSFGSDMLVAGLSQLSPAERARIATVVLVVPSSTIEFRASPSELFNFARPDAEALPLARKVDWVQITCIHGALETGSLCPLWHAPNVRQVTLPGGHHLNRDSDRLARTVFGAIVAATGKAAS